jgi:hypothetical protein
MPERSNYELINNGQVTPQRLHTLLRLVDRRNKSSREDLLRLLQPSELSTNTSAAAAVFVAAVNTGLIVNNTSEGVVTLASGIKRSQLESTDAFRALMQERLCGISDPDEDNYLLNQVVAWYAVQTPDVYRLHKRELAAKFNAELYPRESDADADSVRAINETKLNAWTTWVTFLGWGVSVADVLWPIAHGRLLPRLAPLRRKKLPIADFMNWLAEACPEMDGGTLFEQCWQSSRPSQSRGQQLSSMLSTALGTLHGLKKVGLEYSVDTQSRWQIYPSTDYPYGVVTYITVMET